MNKEEPLESESIPIATPVSLVEPVVSQPWGPWATAGFGLLWLALFAGVQIVTAIIWVVVAKAANPDFDVHAYADQLVYDGSFLTVTEFVTVIPCVAFVMFLAWIRTRSIREYLGLRWPTTGQIFKSCGVLLAYLVIVDGGSWLVGRPIQTEFMVKVSSSAASVVWLYAALVIVAPIIEETFFRGFLISGLARSRLGGLGAVIMTSAIWAIIHLQYEWFDIGVIMGLGLIFGTIRLKTGSTSLTILLHSLVNLIATIEPALFGDSFVA